MNAFQRKHGIINSTIPYYYDFYLVATSPTSTILDRRMQVRKKDPLQSYLQEGLALLGEHTK